MEKIERSELKLKDYRALIIFTIVLSIFFIFGCSDGKEDNQIDFGLIASEKTLPDSFYDVSSGGLDYMVRKSINQSEFEEAWNFYRFENKTPKVDLDKKDIIFIGTVESNSCPYEIDNENMELSPVNKAIKLTLPKQYGACFLAATPRTFVIEIDKETSKDIKNLVIIDESGEETIIPFK
ncbi:hypothetical protein AEA09_03915 [Lysinibacillus contaminans]|uniref:Lipoprotein n=1 Tax=Lysinibacillus contaminans TaxID=1293441 RepID=A0ABR5JZ81_9BACI|nr:hypothetical protein [Lysinibacillus contaminans]KOS67786.1 hypothetical protein AEA09_03915 [Lysinibacillus contaminans]